MDISGGRLTVMNLRDNAAKSERDRLRHTYSGIVKAIVSRANCQITRWDDRDEEKGERGTYEGFQQRLEAETNN